MVVTELNLRLRFRGRKLRGFRCELTRSPRGVFPESVSSVTCQVVVPFLLSGLGTMAAGLVMNTVQVRVGARPRGGRSRVGDRDRGHAGPAVGDSHPEPGLAAKTPGVSGAGGRKGPEIHRAMTILKTPPPEVGLAGPGDLNSFLP